MKITFTLDQVKQFNSLPAEERARIINSCDQLSEMTDEAIDAYKPENEPNEIVTEVHSTLVKRVAARRRRRECKSAKAAVKPVGKKAAATLPTELKISITEGSGRLVMSIQNSFNRFVNQVIHVLEMIDENDLYRFLLSEWKNITETVHNAIQPVVAYAKEYMRMPRARRRPTTFTIPVTFG